MTPSPDRTWLPPIDGRICTRAVAGIGVLMAINLAAMGRVWWCQLGDRVLWSWDVWSTHNSQHLIDPYSLSHIQHGIGLFLLLTLCCGKWLSTEWRILIVAAVEACWEIAENTPMVIDRYREATISLDYYGDSMLNSLSDYAMCLLGVAIAVKLHWRLSLVLFVALEVASLIWIRDSLMLNILMLLYPLDVIRQWQAGG